jgi:transcriptional repressor NrdR
LKCPACRATDNHVVDSRLGKEGDVVRRRRECEKCGRRFTTYERIEEYLPSVIKKDGRREPFDRLKIMAGMRRACEKRPVSVETLEAIVDAIERRLLDSGEREVQSTAIGEVVCGALHDIDEVAYVRFASVYRSFQDIGEFMTELQDLIHKRHGKQAAKRTRLGARAGGGAAGARRGRAPT